ncbi:MAG: SDR family oxidoreductase [Actinomycetaceae bacterium]|nr:SDR family oxidoreductase [Actinomycetaceae bacterium]
MALSYLRKYFVPGTPIQGSWMLVTGAGSGIGKQLALQAARAGASLILWDRNVPAMEEVAHVLQARGTEAVTQEVDLLSPDSIAAAAEATKLNAPRVDILINCAGVVTGKDFMDVTAKDLDFTFGVNTFAPFHVTRAFLPEMIAQGAGSIVTISSAAGLIGVKRQTDYSASKFAAFGFMDSLRGELRANGTSLHTMTVFPFYVDTGMFEGVRTKVPFLLPILKEREVAIKVLRGIQAGRVTLVLPPFARIAQLGRLNPAPIGDMVADLLGLNEGMDHFRGRIAKTAGKKG